MFFLIAITHDVYTATCLDVMISQFLLIRPFLCIYSFVMPKSILLISGVEWKLNSGLEYDSQQVHFEVWTHSVAPL